MHMCVCLKEHTTCRMVYVHIEFEFSLVDFTHFTKHHILMQKSRIDTGVIISTKELHRFDSVRRVLTCCAVPVLSN